MNYLDGMTNGTTLSGHRLENEKGLSIVLISTHGSMQDLKILYDSEGVYSFLAHGTKKQLIKISNQDGTWMAQCASPACFLSANGLSREKTVSLYHKAMYRIEAGEDGYYLYAEGINDWTMVRHNYYVEKNQQIVIGRNEDCDIMVRSSFVSRQHARLVWDGNAWTIADSNSTNGVFANNVRVTSTMLHAGDSVYIMGLRMVLGYGFLSINDGNDRVMIRSPRIHEIKSVSDLNYTIPAKTQTEEKDFFNRTPREREIIKGESIYFDNPPASMANGQVPFLLRMSSPAIMGGNALLTGNYVMAMTSLMIPFLTQGYTEKQRKEYETARVEKYGQYLEAKKQEIAEERSTEERILKKTYPELSEVVNWPDNGKRLWERRNVDDDFLEIRLGHGDIPMIAEYDYDKESFSMDDDKLLDDLHKITEHPETLRNVPVTTNLVKDYVCGVQGKPGDIRTFIRNMMTQIVLTHSYDEVKLVLLCSKEDEQYFERFRFQPHMWDDGRTIRFLASDFAGAVRIGAHIGKELEEDLKTV